MPLKKKQKKTTELKENGKTRTTVKHILMPGSNINNRFIDDYNELKQIVRILKEMGYQVVLTQGVYDLIHEGHAAYLEAARSYGDILIVGVDSDELTRKRKGPSRPIVPEMERLKMLTHLRHVDIVTLRDEKDGGVGDIIRIIQPDVLVLSKSTKDFTFDMVKKYGPFCGKIVTLPPQATVTTTGRIRNLAIEGVEKLNKEIENLTKDFLGRMKV